MKGIDPQVRKLLTISIVCIALVGVTSIWQNSCQEIDADCLHSQVRYESIDDEEHNIYCDACSDYLDYGSHDYEDDGSGAMVCTECGHECEHSDGFSSGQCDYCGMDCPHESTYSDDCGSDDEHEIYCSECDEYLDYGSHDYEDDGSGAMVCTECEHECEHSDGFGNGECEYCGTDCPHEDTYCWDNGMDDEHEICCTECDECLDYDSHDYWYDDSGAKVCTECEHECGHSDGFSSGRCDYCGTDCPHENSYCCEYEWDDEHEICCTECDECLDYGSHDYEDDGSGAMVCTECGHECGHSDGFGSGQCEYCGMECPHESTYSDDCEDDSEHEIYCDVCGGYLYSDSHDYEDDGSGAMVCTECEHECGHCDGFSSGQCEYCGMDCPHDDTYCCDCGSDDEHAICCTECESDLGSDSHDYWYDESGAMICSGCDHVCTHSDGFGSGQCDYCGMDCPHESKYSYDCGTDSEHDFYCTECDELLDYGSHDYEWDDGSGAMVCSGCGHECGHSEGFGLGECEYCGTDCPHDDTYCCDCGSDDEHEIRCEECESDLGSDSHDYEWDDGSGAMVCTECGHECGHCEGFGSGECEYCGTDCPHENSYCCDCGEDAEHEICCTECDECLDYGSHDYEDDGSGAMVCTECEHECGHSDGFSSGECEYCGMECPHENSYCCDYEWDDEHAICCTECDECLDYGSHDYEDDGSGAMVCTECEHECGHSDGFSNGECEYCGTDCPHDDTYCCDCGEDAEHEICCTECDECLDSDSHDYEDDGTGAMVCTECGHECGHSDGFSSGECEYCGTECPHDDTYLYDCMSDDGHEIRCEECDECLDCDSHDYEDDGSGAMVCTECGHECGHRDGFGSGQCEYCGMECPHEDTCCCDNGMDDEHEICCTECDEYLGCDSHDYWYDGSGAKVCIECEHECGHSDGFSSGRCDYCGIDCPHESTYCDDWDVDDEHDIRCEECDEYMGSNSHNYEDDGSGAMVCTECNHVCTHSDGFSGGSCPFCGKEYHKPQSSSKVTITLHSSSDEGGKVVGSGSYSRGSIVTIKAVPNPGYKFISWSDGVTDSERTMFILFNTSYTAFFEKETVITETMTLNASEFTMNSGDTYILVATVTPLNATDKSIVWSSSDETIASVDIDGTVKALNPGKVSITVTANDGGCNAICSITVTDATSPPIVSGDGLVYAAVIAVALISIIVAFVILRSRKVNI